MGSVEGPEVIYLKHQVLGKVTSVWKLEETKDLRQKQGLRQSWPGPAQDREVCATAAVEQRGGQQTKSDEDR